MARGNLVRDQVADALEGGFLEGREVRELSTDWGVTFAVDIVPSELREAWRELRALVPRLERWPVAAMAMWDGPFDERSFRAGSTARRRSPQRSAPVRAS